MAGTKTKKELTKVVFSATQLEARCSTTFLPPNGIIIVDNIDIIDGLQKMYKDLLKHEKWDVHKKCLKVFRQIILNNAVCPAYLPLNEKISYCRGPATLGPIIAKTDIVTSMDEVQALTLAFDHIAKKTHTSTGIGIYCDLDSYRNNIENIIGKNKMYYIEEQKRIDLKEDLDIKEILDDIAIRLGEVPSPVDEEEDVSHTQLGNIPIENLEDLDQNNDEAPSTNTCTKEPKAEFPICTDDGHTIPYCAINSNGLLLAMINKISPLVVFITDDSKSDNSSKIKKNMFGSDIKPDNDVYNIHYHEPGFRYLTNILSDPSIGAPRSTNPNINFIIDRIMRDVNFREDVTQDDINFFKGRLISFVIDLVLNNVPFVIIDDFIADHNCIPSLFSYGSIRSVITSLIGDITINGNQTKCESVYAFVDALVTLHKTNTIPYDIRSHK